MTKTTIGEKSMAIIPARTGGITLCKGFSTGSVTSRTSVKTARRGPDGGGGNQDMMIRTNRITQYTVSAAQITLRSGLAARKVIGRSE